MTSNQSCPITLALQPLDEIPDVVLQIFFVLLRADPIHAICGVLSDEQPTLFQMLFVDQPVEIQKTDVAYSLLPSLLWLAVRLALLLRPFLAGQCFLCTLRTSVSP